MNTQDAARHDHDDIKALLPWHVRQTLAPADRARVQRHLEDCAECAETLAEDQALAQCFDQREEPVWQPSEAHFQRLMALIDATPAKTDAAIPAAEPTPEPAPRTRAARPSRRVPGWLEGLRELPNLVRWTLAAQSLALAGLAVALILPRVSPAPPEAGLFQTYSRDTGAPVAAGPRLRVVFAPTTPVGELPKLTRAVSAQIVAGPSALGVYTLELAAGASVEAALATLRGSPQVVLAEVVTGP